jgi:hypothetical protein
LGDNGASLRVAEELAGRLPAGTGYQPVLPSVLAIGHEEEIAGVATDANLFTRECTRRDANES